MSRVLKGLFCWLMFVGGVQGQSFNSQIITLNQHPSHLITWGDMSDKTKPELILLSGPIDSWHSDSAWWATVAEPLSKQYRVFALDRAGQVTANPKANVGYLPLADDLHELIRVYKMQNPMVVAFASSNLTIMQYLNKHHQSQPLKAVVMIDPDVLTEFSIKRYQGDAEPFEQNLDKYLAYIGEGKYVDRVKQKNANDRALIEKLAVKKPVDWSLVDKMFNHRLDIVNQQNQFREIAIYGKELASVANIPWPQSLPLMVIDTQFEQAYIEHSEDQKAIEGLSAWQQDGKQYYQGLASEATQGVYLEVKSKAHLYQVENPQRFITKLTEFLNRL